MRIYVYDSDENKRTNGETGWTKGGENISYSRSKLMGIVEEGEPLYTKPYYQMQFTYTFKPN